VNIVLGVLLIALGTWRLMFGLSHFGILRLRVVDSPGWSRMPRWFRGDERLNALLDCIGGPLFIAAGIAVSLV
jgi:hypothetical protein